MAADTTASSSSQADVQNLLAQRQTQVMNGAGGSAEAVVITNKLTALGVN